MMWARCSLAFSGFVTNSRVKRWIFYQHDRWETNTNRAHITQEKFEAQHTHGLTSCSESYTTVEINCLVTSIHVRKLGNTGWIHLANSDHAWDAAKDWVQTTRMIRGCRTHTWFLPDAPTPVWQTCYGIHLFSRYMSELECRWGTTTTFCQFLPEEYELHRLSRIIRPDLWRIDWWPSISNTRSMIREKTVTAKMCAGKFRHSSFRRRWTWHTGHKYEPRVP